MTRRRVVLVTYPGLQPLDIVGPAEVFTTAGRLAPDSYRIEVVAPDRSPLSSHSSGYAIVPARSTAGCRGAIDTLIVAGGIGARAAAADQRLVGWVRAAAARSRRVASVCTGAFVLGAAGLLDGHRATTHWASCRALAELHPGVDVDPDPIFIRDGSTWTSAGVTAGIDLALALVEEDLGGDLARETARWLVVFLQRPGGQAQFSSHLTRSAASRQPLRELQGWMADHLDGDLRVEALAERVAMSPRNFARAFRHEVGLTPAAYIQALRLEAARQRLEQGAEPVDEVARRVGFGTPETMRRAFARHLGIPPADYRSRFKRVPEMVA